MSLQKFTQAVEMKFWKSLTPLMDVQGPIMRCKQLIYKMLHSKTGFSLLLVVVWGAVGFAGGLLIGRVIGLLSLP